MTDTPPPELPSFDPQAIESAMAAPARAPAAPDGGAEPAPAASPAPLGPPAPLSMIEKPSPTSAPAFSQGDIADAYEASQNEEKLALRATLMQGSQQNADQVAKALPIAKSMGLPVQTVQNNLPMLTRQQQFTQEYVDTLQKQYPNTAQWLKDPTNAALATDDISNLTQIEGLSTAATIADKAALSYNAMFQPLKYLYAYETGNQPMMDRVLNDLQTGKELSAQMTPDYTNRPMANFLYGAAQGTADFLPAMLTAAVNPIAGFAAFAGQGGLGEAGDIQARGGTAAQIIGGGAAAGAVYGAAGPILGRLAESILSKTPLPQFIINALSHGAIPMAGMNIGGAAVDTAIANPNKSAEDFWHELPETAATGILQGLFFHGVTSGYAAAKDFALTRVSSEYAAAKAAQNVAPVIQQMADTAADSKLRERSPDSFHAFMQKATEDSPISTLWVEPTALQTAGVDPAALAAALPAHARDIADAVQNNFAIKIPAADFATSLADTDIGKALVPHLKTDPNGMSQVEADEFVDSGAAAKFTTELEKAARSDDQDTAFQKSAQAVQDQIKARYAATGRFPEDVNATVARLGSFYNHIAMEYGITPEEAYRIHGAGVSGADMRPTAGQSFDGTKPAAETAVIAPPVGGENVAQTMPPAEGADIDSALKTLRQKSDKAGMKSPLINYLKQGGFSPKSEAAAFLKEREIKIPGLIKREKIDKKTGQRFPVTQGLDNIPADELRSHFGDTLTIKEDGNGYVDPEWLKEQIEKEWSGGAAKTTAEDQNIDQVSAEIQHYGLDLKTMDDAAIKEKILKGRADEAKSEASALGFSVNDAQAAEVAKMVRQGYDVHDALDSVLERGDLHDLDLIGKDYGFDFADIPFPDIAQGDETAAPIAGDAADGDRPDAGNDEVGEAAGSGETEGNSGQDAGAAEPTLFGIREDTAADIARRTANQRLSNGVPQKGMNDTDLFDENGRAIDSQKEFFQKDNEPNAAYNPDTKQIWLGKKANLTSMLHEEGHHFLNVYTRLALAEGAPERIREIADAALKHLGVEGATPEERIGKWNAMSLKEQEPFHEKWARGFERYLFRGKSPSVEMQPAFDAFRGWLKHVYTSIRNFVSQNPEAGELNEELRGVMDRMLASDQEIEYARRVRSFSTLFQSPEEAKAVGMTPDEYKAYQNLNSQSMQDAASELQARSLRDMALTRRMHERTVRDLNIEARAKRKAIQDEVTQEVMQEPVNRARNFLKRGEVNGEAVQGIHKLDVDILKDQYGNDKDSEWRLLEEKYGKHGIIGKGGLHPDDVAEQFGFETGGDMIRAMVNQPSITEQIGNLTDQRMIERYGDLTDPRTIARRADQAVHNEARIRSVATELNALRKALGKSKILHDAAKQYAKTLVDRQENGDINPNKYASAAAKSSKLAEDAMRKGDLAGAAEAKRNQLVNEYATKAAYDAQDEVAKIRTNARRYDKKTVRKNIGTDIEQIDALLDQYNMRKSAVEKIGARRQSLLDWYNSQIEADYEPIIDDQIIQRAANPEAKIHYATLTMPELRSLDVALRTVESTAKVRKEITVEGKKMAVNTAVSEIVGRMMERGDKFTTDQLLNRPEKGVDSIHKVWLDRLGSALRAGNASLTAPDFLANKYDLHEINGPMRKYLFNRIWDRNYWKNENLAKISRTFEEKVKELGPDWQKSLYDKIPNSTLIDKAASTDSTPVYRRLTRGQMLGIARHVGNESNFAKLVQGMGWKGEDVWRFLHANMREADWKAVAAEWAAFEEHWPEIEGMVRRLGGEVPEKIPLRPFQTQFGEMKGGYAPIEYDPLRSNLAKRLGDVKADASKSIGQGEYYKASTTMNSSLRNRAEGYSDIVNLDYHYMTRRLHETIHDLAYREAILDAKKIIEHPDFRDQFQHTFGPEEYQNLQDFITNVRDMYKRDNAMDGFTKAIQYSRQSIILNGVGYRISTVLKHGSGAALKSLGYLEGEGKQYLAARALRMSTGNLHADIEDAKAKFPEIANRLRQQDRDFSAGEHSLYDKEDWRAKNNRFSHAMVAWSDALTAIPTAHAAYDWATTTGIPKKYGGSGKPMSHAEAVQYADSIVRQAHGSALDSARSNFLHQKGLGSLLGMIYQFENATFGQIKDSVDKAAQPASRYQSNPSIAGRLAAQLVAPAMVAYLLTNGWKDEAWYKQIGMAIGGGIASTVPLLRDGWGMVEAMAEGRDWHSGALQLPPVRVAGDIIAAVSDAVKEAKGKDTRIIQDAGNAIGEAFHIAGLGQLGKTGQYVHDVSHGKQHPATSWNYVKGATIGPPPKGKR